MITVPFDSWANNLDITNTTEQANLEQYFGPAAVAFNTYQGAVSGILEVLGARSSIVPVIMSITASPDTLAAVLRAGGDPILLDIHPQTLQIDPTLLRSILDEIKTAVVIFARPGGQPVDPQLLEMTKDLPTILDSRLPPHAHIVDDCVCTFNVFDLGVVVGSGAVVIHRFKEQVTELKQVRSGLLGLSGSLNSVLAGYALRQLKHDPVLATRRSTQEVSVMTYVKLVQDKLTYPFDSSPEWPYFVVGVENADKAVAHLHGFGIEIVKPVFPLHLLSDINRRWVEKPEYPVAESLCGKLVALPTHLGILGKEDMIISTLLEVSNG